MVKDRQFNPTVVVLATLACGDSAGAAQCNEVSALFNFFLSVKIAENLSWWGSSDSSNTDDSGRWPQPPMPIYTWVCWLYLGLLA